MLVYNCMNSNSLDAAAAHRLMRSRRTPRLTYTGLMTASSLSTSPPEQPHRNLGLFSDHYLSAMLPTGQEWEKLT